VNLKKTERNFIGALLFTNLFLCYTSAHQIPRTDTGEINRSATAVRQFKKTTGFPKGRPGYEIDHITPLYKGGCDSQENMQWLTIEDHRKKTGREQ